MKHLVRLFTLAVILSIAGVFNSCGSDVKWVDPDRIQLSEKRFENRDNVNGVVRWFDFHVTEDDFANDGRYYEKYFDNSSNYLAYDVLVNFWYTGNKWSSQIKFRIYKVTSVNPRHQPQESDFSKVAYYKDNPETIYYEGRAYERVQ